MAADGSNKRELPFGRPMIGIEERNAVLDVLDGPILVHGERVAAFEREFAAYTGATRAVAVSSCTAALHLVLMALGVGPGDEVVVPAQTHVATAHAAEFLGARAVFADVDPRTGSLDPAGLERAIGPRCRAIMVVHFMGLPGDMPAIRAIADRRGIPMIEDCALSIGGRIAGIHTGLHGIAGCFSFYPVKHMTTAEGGMVITNDPALADKISKLRAFGVDRTHGERVVPGQYDVSMLGFNYRMNEIEAALGREQIKRLPDILAQRRRNWRRLNAALAGVTGIEVIRTEEAGKDSGYYALSVVLADALEARRIDIITHLRDAGIGTSIYYPTPVPFMSYYREKYGPAETEFPHARKISRASITLPVGPHLSENDMAFIGATFAGALERILP